MAPQKKTIRLLILGTYRDTDLDRAHPLAAVQVQVDMVQQYAWPKV